MSENMCFGGATEGDRGPFSPGEENNDGFSGQPQDDLPVLPGLQTPHYSSSRSRTSLRMSDDQRSTRVTTGDHQPRSLAEDINRGVFGKQPHHCPGFPGLERLQEHADHGHGNRIEERPARPYKYPTPRQLTIMLPVDRDRHLEILKEDMTSRNFDWYSLLLRKEEESQRMEKGYRTAAAVLEAKRNDANERAQNLSEELATQKEELSRACKRLEGSLSEALEAVEHWERKYKNLVEVMMRIKQRHPEIEADL